MPEIGKARCAPVGDKENFIKGSISKIFGFTALRQYVHVIFSPKLSDEFASANFVRRHKLHVLIIQSAVECFA